MGPKETPTITRVAVAGLASYSGRCGCVDLVDELDADGFDCLANRRAIGRIHLSQSTWFPGRNRARINAIDSNKIGFVS